MLKNYKLVALTVVLVFITILLTGCASGELSENEIEIAISNYKDFAERNVTIKSFIIDKRQTNKEEKKDIVYCSIAFEDYSIRYEEQYICTFNYYDQGGWILDDVEKNNINEWDCFPITGIDVDTAITEIILISTNNFPVKCTYDSIVFKEQNTNLDTNTDIITIEIQKDNGIISISGDLNITFVFNKVVGTWEIVNVEKGNNYIENWKNAKFIGESNAFVFGGDKIVSLSFEEMQLNGQAKAIYTGLSGDVVSDLIGTLSDDVDEDLSFTLYSKAQNITYSRKDIY